jgi:hypothetical protein
MSEKDIFDELSVNLRCFRDLYDQVASGRWQDEVTDWINSFITRPHASLGRKGAVCPFVQKSLDSGLLAVTHLATPRDLKIDAGSMIIDAMRALFEQTFVAERRELGALVLAFPQLALDRAGAFIDGAHRLNRRRMIHSGVALGEFHPGSTTPGIHNADFHPMYSPVPIFVMRALSKHDVFFLNRGDFAIEDRIGTMRSFIDQMAGYMNAHEKVQLDKDLVSLRREVENEDLADAIVSDLKKLETDLQ